jgi:cell division protein FtsX
MKHPGFILFVVLITAFLFVGSQTVRAECYFRRVEIRPLNEFPAEIKSAVPW